MTELAVRPDTDAPEAVEEEEPTTLVAVLEKVHAREDETAKRLADAKPERKVEAYEAEVAVTCSHLGWLKTYVLPLAAKRLPAERTEVAKVLADSREVERLMRAMHLCLHGAQQARGGCTSLQDQLNGALERLRVQEDELLGHLQAALSVDDCAALAKKVSKAAIDGPTRPHPHALSRFGLRRVSYHLGAMIDHTLDGLESRVLPSR